MASDQALEFKGATLQIIHALLRSADPTVLAEALRQQTGGSTDFFSGEPAVLDFSHASDLPAAIDWAAILGLLRTYQLKPAGIRSADPVLRAAAEAAGLIELDDAFFGRPGRALAAAPAPVQPPPPEPVAPPPTVVKVAEPMHTLIIEKPLRSGQQVYARGADLIVLAMVSAGAEVIADGNIHVYAPLRGRALAGAQGDKSARVFTTCLEAELVSVAGIYRTFEQGLPPELVSQPAKVGLDESAGALTLRIEALPIR